MKPHKPGQQVFIKADSKWIKGLVVDYDEKQKTYKIHSDKAAHVVDQKDVSLEVPTPITAYAYKFYSIEFDVSRITWFEKELSAEQLDKVTQFLNDKVSRAEEFDMIFPGSL